MAVRTDVAAMTVVTERTVVAARTVADLGKVPKFPYMVILL